MVIVPPYLGLPRLSHQFPVVAVVVVVAVVDVTVFVGDIIVEVAVVVDAEVGCVVFVADVDVLQEDKTSDVNIRPVRTVQIAPFFTHISFLPN
jgi:hypothetical protein